jgi:hypothetical protein
LPHPQPPDFFDVELSPVAHFPMGQDSDAHPVFMFRKHPHLLHVGLSSAPALNGQLLQIAKRLLFVCAVTLFIPLLTCLAEALAKFAAFCALHFLAFNYLLFQMNTALMNKGIFLLQS